MISRTHTTYRRDRYGQLNNYKVNNQNFEIEGEFHSGLARAIKKDSFTEEKFIGFVSLNNEVIIPFKYPYQGINKVAELKDGIVCVQNGFGKFGVLDKENELILNFEYEDIFICSYHEKSLIVYKKNDFYGMRINDKEVLNTIYDFISIDRRGGCYTMTKEIYFYKGKKVGLFLYDTIICDTIAKWSGVYGKTKYPGEYFDDHPYDISISKLNEIVLGEKSRMVIPDNIIVYKIFSGDKHLIIRVMIQNNSVIKKEKIMECNDNEFSHLGMGFVSISEKTGGRRAESRGDGRFKNKGKDIICNTVNGKYLDLNTLPNGKWMNIYIHSHGYGLMIEITVNWLYLRVIEFDRNLNIVSNKKKWFK